jgi:hypothetical protein
VGLLLTAACGSDAPSDPAHDLVTLGLPGLVAIRADGKPWESLTPRTVELGNAHYQLPTASTLDVMVACDTVSVAAYELRTTTGDGLLDGYRVYPDCRKSIPRQTLTVNIHDDQVVAKYVNVGDVQKIDTSDSDWSVDLTAQQPRADVIAYDDHRALVDHDIDLLHGPATATLDLTQGRDLQTGTFTFDPIDSDEIVGDDSALFTKNGSVAIWIGADGGGSYVRVPADLMDPADVQYVDIATQWRSVSYPNDPQLPAHWTWLPRLQSVSISSTATSATFGPVPFPYAYDAVNCQADSGQEVVVETASWRALQADVTVLAFDEGVPGWRPEWAISAAGRQCSYFVSEGVSNANTRTTAYLDPSPAAATFVRGWTPALPFRPRL